MSIPVHNLEAQVLCLPPEDRARLLELLIASLESESQEGLAATRPDPSGGRSVWQSGDGSR